MNDLQHSCNQEYKVEATMYKYFLSMKRSGFAKRSEFTCNGCFSAWPAAGVQLCTFFLACSKRLCKTSHKINLRKISFSLQIHESRTWLEAVSFCRIAYSYSWNRRHTYSQLYCIHRGNHMHKYMYLHAVDP